MLYSLIVDCGIPGPPISGSIVNYSGTKVGDIVTYMCNKGYRPSAKINGTCRVDSIWFPQPERHICTLISGIQYRGAFLYIVATIGE